MVGDRGDEWAGGDRGVRPRLAGLPAQPVGRPVRQEERYDPSHRTPPISIDAGCRRAPARDRSEEHTSELQSLMRISYAVFCLIKKNTNSPQQHIITQTNN